MLNAIGQSADREGHFACRGRKAAVARLRLSFLSSPRPRLSLSLVIAVFLALISASGVVHAAASVGMVTKVTNDARVNGGPAAVGTILHMNDSVTTGAQSKLELTFRDNTTLSLGENAKVVIDKFVFNPEASTGDLLVNTTRGAFRMVTGRIGDMKDKDIGVTTNAAALAVRGTDFWWGPMKGQTGVLLVSNSRVDVQKVGEANSGCPRHKDEPSCNADAQSFCSWETSQNICRSCEVTLDQHGQGTYVSKGGCPSKPSMWSPQQIQQALSQTQVAAATPATSVTSIAPAAAGAAAAAGGFVGSTVISRPTTTPRSP